MSSNFILTRSERIICSSLTLLYVIRMLGLFIILPIFSLYGQEVTGSTPFLMGLAFGSYAVAQMILTPVFGYASDKYGRKIVLIVGLLLFIFGSILIAFSHHIYMVLVGRIIQGSGAISAVILALATDLTREAVRTKIMATIGISIGLTFGFAMFLGPFLQNYIGMQGIFLVCAGLGLTGILIVQFVLPSSEQILFLTSVSVKQQQNKLDKKTALQSVIFNPNLWRLYCGALFLHLLLSMAFMVIPINLKQADLALALHWKIYVPCFIFSLVVMGAAVGICEKKGRLKVLFLSAIMLLILAFFVFNIAHSLWMIALAISLFFVGFNIMEATQPSLMARFTPPATRGIAMGVFSSMQFLGASIGGGLGGFLSGYMALNSVYLIAVLVATIWFSLAFGMTNPSLRTHSKV